MLQKLVAAHRSGKLALFGSMSIWPATRALAAFLAPLRRTRWFVCSKRPFAGPRAVLAYLSRPRACGAVHEGPASETLQAFTTALPPKDGCSWMVAVSSAWCLSRRSESFDFMSYARS
jgi:hypothetical protein